MLKPGKKAPAFRLPSTAGKDVALKDLKGKRVVLYFYPRDQTPGCTQEACDFRDNLARLRAAGAVVLGVSKDSLDSHERFRAKQSLPFDLLTDADNAVATAYGAYGEKVMYGRRVQGTIRSTVLIDEDGKVVKVWSPVRVKGHVDDVLATLEGKEGKASGSAGRATRKKAASRKVTKKATRKKATKKAATRKTAKKATRKKATKKAATRKTAKKATRKKTTKKAATRKTAKKATRKKTSRRK